jgi:hypothetical protein
MIPRDQSTFTDEDIIDIMNEELAIHILPMVLRFHEEHYVIDEDISLAADQIRYKIPYRSVGNKLRDVQFIDNAGTQYEMTRVSLEDRPEYQGNYTNNQFLTFYLENDDVVIMQNQISNGSLRMSYYLRPNNLVDDKRAGTITNIAVGATQTVFTVNDFPQHFNVTTVFDFIQGRSPNKILGFDRTATGTDSVAKTVTFDNDQLLTIDLFSITPKALTFAVGDMILKEEETIVPQLPAELHPILAQRVAVKMLEALGDTEGMQNASKELEKMEYNAGSLIDNRVEGAAVKISNRHSILKSSLSNKLYRRRGL